MKYSPKEMVLRLGGAHREVCSVLDDYLDWGHKLEGELVALEQLRKVSERAIVDGAEFLEAIGEKEMKELKDFTTAELQAEIDRREAESKEAAKDRDKRTYYKKLELATVKEKAKWLMENPDAETKERKGELYVATEETDEELQTRLSRTAHAYEDYDQSKCDFYENGKKVGYSTYEMLWEAESDAEMWENDLEWWADRYDFPTKPRYYPYDFYTR